MRESNVAITHILVGFVLIGKVPEGFPEGVCEGQPAGERK